MKIPIYHIQIKTENKELIDTIKKIVDSTNERGKGIVTATYKEFDKDKHQISFEYNNLAPVLFKKIVFRELKKGITSKFPDAVLKLVGDKSIGDRIKSKIKGS
jgi:hypothetical protein